MAELLSNALVIVNVADGEPGASGAPGTSYYIHIRYSEHEDGTDFSEQPGPYIGIYSGPSATAPVDKTQYQWSKIQGADGASTYVDIRYSDDGETFTSNNGTTPGNYIGVYVTTDKAVTLPTYVPVFSNYTWNLIAGDDSKSSYYRLSYNNNKVNKFLASNSGLQDNQYVSYYSYSPSTLTATIEKISLVSTYIPTELNISAYYNYYDDQHILHTGEFPEQSVDGVISLDLTAQEYSTRNIQSISFIVKNNEGQIFSDIINVDYGLTEDMAKFSLNATSIVQSILNTTLTFDTDGLTVKNGGFTIKNNDNQKVFYADDNGNLFFSGSISTMSGSLGGWIIGVNGLYDSNSRVGMYSGQETEYQLGGSPIRFWAGKDIENNLYNFAVTQEGVLYAKDMILKGELSSQNGHIKNKLMVGSPEDGIVIYGNSDDSYISSSQFASGAAGYGWKVNQDGSAEFSNITARGKIQSSVFEYNKVSSIGGSLYISPTIYMETFSEPITLAAQVYSIKWISPYTNSQDICGHSWTIQDFVKLNGEVLIGNTKVTLANIDAQITDITTNDTVEFTFAIPAASLSSPITGGKIAPGGTIILYGTGNKKQGLYLTAADRGSPYMDVYDSDVNSVLMPAVRLGNLSGISDSSFPGEKLEGYGLYSSNAYLRGQLMLPGAGITNQNNISYGAGEANSPIRLWAGNDGNDITKANFIVTANGYMYAKQGVFEGTVKASNSEFSGTIRAAGVVIDENGTGENPAQAPDHFFVAYKENPSSFNDYVLDMSANGLSVWEGALRAYSDFASGENNYPTPYKDDIYGYDSTKPNKMPLPYFTLVDSGTENELDARIAAHKAHFANIYKKDTKYYVNSTIISNGIWFGQNTYDNISSTIENTSYYKVANDKRVGINYDDNVFNIKGETVNISSERGYFNYTAALIKTTNTNGFHIRGPLSVQSDGTDNVIIIGNHTIKQKMIDDVSIGLDFIIK